MTSARSRFVLPQLGLALLLLTLLAAARPASAQSLGWTTLERDDLHFAINFPGELPPESALRTLDPQFAAIHNWPSAGTQELLRFVAYDLEDDDTTDAGVLAVVRDQLLAATATGERPTLDSATPLTWNGFPGLALAYHDSQWQYRSRVYVVRRFDKAFATTVTTYPDRPFSPDAATFESSLQIVSSTTTTASLQ